MVKGKIRNRSKVEIDRHGTATTTGAAPGLVGRMVANANRWRENYNPLRNLTIKRAVELLEMGQRGDTALLMWTYRFTEETHPTLSALLTRCESPLLNFDWEIKIKKELPEIEGRTPDQVQAMAEEQQATLRAAYEAVDNLKAAIKHLHLAEFRGYAHLQKHRADDGTVTHLEPLDQWCVCREGLYGDWYWNPDSRFVVLPKEVLGEENRIGGNTLPGEDFIIREVDRPIDRIALINFVRQNLCEKDADGFIEIYGIPGGVVVMPPNVPQGKEGEYESAAKAVAEGGSGAIPNGSDYKPNDGPRGVDPFTPRLKHLDEQLIMVGTGGKLTMLAESGSGTLAGNAHSDTFEEIANGRAQKISERFQRDFDAEVLERKHKDEPFLVYFKLGKADEDSEEITQFTRETVKSLLANQTTAMAIAKQTNLKELVSESGLPVQEDVDANELLEEEPTENPDSENPANDPNNPEPHKGGTPDKIANRQGDPGPNQELIDNGVDHYAAALAHDMEVFREELEAISRIDDDRVFAQRVVALNDKLDQLKEDILHLPKSAQALAEVMIAGLMTGLTENRTGKITNGDRPGHDFRGNQWTDAAAAATAASNKASEDSQNAKSGRDHANAAKSHYAAAKAHLDAAGQALKEDKFDAYKHHAEMASTHMKAAAVQKSIKKEDDKIRREERKQDATWAK